MRLFMFINCEASTSVQQLKRNPSIRVIKIVLTHSSAKEGPGGMLAYSFFPSLNVSLCSNTQALTQGCPVDCNGSG